MESIKKQQRGKGETGNRKSGSATEEERAKWEAKGVLVEQEEKDTKWETERLVKWEAIRVLEEKGRERERERCKE